MGFTPVFQTVQTRVDSDMKAKVKILPTTFFRYVDIKKPFLRQIKLLIIVPAKLINLAVGSQIAIANVLADLMQMWIGTN